MNRVVTVSQAAERWAKDLTDVSGRNRLLFYRDLKVGTLNLANAHPGEVARLLSSVPGKQIRLRRLFSGPGTIDQDLADDAVRRARAISRKALENFEERGISTLFIVQGMATWTTETSSATPAAPVLMCPLGLHRRGASEADFNLSLDGEWTVNGALLQSLAREFGVEASSEELLGSYLSDARLDEGEVAAIFDDLSNRASRIPGFAIQRQRMLIGNFMYKKMPMVNDLLNNLELLAENDLVSAIAGDEHAGTNLRRHHTHDVDPSHPDSIPPADEFLVLDADSSQNAAINAALAGESFVLQGPPGTGKSQTIANLIATMMARGRSVLFVAEKRAAIDTRSNPDEVGRVVELMIDHAEQRPDETLGVIAMGLSHASRIEEMLRRRLDQESSPALEAFFDEMAEERAFVKNLERVQGDERDAVILSVGYGKTSDGRLMYRFGPLNAEGGERRLNVAVTRARRRMTVVSSFSHTEMDPNRSSALGVQHLRGFLRYAESGGSDLSDTAGTTPLNPFELDVLDKLTAAGLDVLPQYGCSGYRIDFAVRHPDRPGRFALAVEADGASYHSSPTARDRDRLRQDHLERLGWRFCRIWSTDWFSDHTREVDRVMQAYRLALTEIDSEKSTTAATARDKGKPEKVVNMAPSRNRTPLPLVPQSLPIHQHDPWTLVLLAQWVMSDGLLRTDEQVFEEMFAQMGYKSRGKRIKEALYRAIEQAKG